MWSALPVIVPLLIGLSVSGCGLIRQQQAQERYKEVTAQVHAAENACEVSYPADNPKTAVARAKCLNDAEEIGRSVFPYPDLFESAAATRLALAEQVQNGKLTVIQANELLANKATELVTEANRWLSGYLEFLGG
jgi:hypothetical protein